jgi:hypothetical protein
MSAKTLSTVAVLMALILVRFSAARDPVLYDFRTSESYANLPTEEARQLEQVHYDFTLLRGALEKYADDHGDQVPEKLEALVGVYLRELPRDAFATDDSAADQHTGIYIRSLDGRGYRYCQGVGRAWIISSVGLPTFPYLAPRGNVGLYQAKGIWISGEQAVTARPAKSN